MTQPTLTVACGVYDRTAGLFDGSVRAEGLNLNMIGMLPGELFRRQARHAEFDACEFSLSTHLMLRSRGDNRFVGIPVYPARRFRHEHVWVNAGCGIEAPADLRGRRVGVQEFLQTASVWIRGFLAEDYGVPQESIEWFFGGYNAPEPSFAPRIPLEVPSQLTVSHVAPDSCMNEMLLDGRLDAMLPGRPRAFDDGDPRVRPLFARFWEVEADYYRRTGIFPIMHCVVIKRELYERAPWMAVSLYQAFATAKAQAFSRMWTYPGPLYSSLPWQTHHLAETERLMGEDYWSYGFARNRGVIEKLAGLLHDQGLLAGSLGDVADAFAPETLELDGGVTRARTPVGSRGGA